MQILMDIDGTIAYRNDAQFVQLLWQSLGFTPDMCPRVGSMAEFLALPQVSAARSRIGERRFRMLISMLQQSESAIASCLVIHGAYEALHQLAHIGQLRYCTARKATYSGANGTTAQAVDEINTRMQRATYDWLAQHDFPCSDQVIFCSGAKGKLETVAACTHESGKVMLVDNEPDAIREAFTALPQQVQASIIARTTMLAFGQDGCQSAPQSMELRYLPLPTWDCLDNVLSALAGMGKDSHIWKLSTASQNPFYSPHHLHHSPCRTRPTVHRSLNTTRLCILACQV